ncbi:probable protein disulfide-isomerase A4 [Photinus pyralis]|uniref:probable protein disulfide-isomerase A4 n=1 Tax=Photinus pyralis TaxID=7054 RepID=UPI001266F078|nr:probable protein disulfide-isomerase A4 [Photinus pyralis]
MACVNKFFLIFISLILPFGGYGQVYELSSVNFEAVISQYKILVHFYSSVSPGCRQMSTDYSVTAASLTKSGSDIKLGRLSCDLERTLCVEAGVKFVPTIKYYRNGAVIDYTGSRTAVGFLTFLSKYP